MEKDFDKTAKLNVTVKNRAVIFPIGFDLNALRRDEFQAELILSESDFVKKEVFEALVKEAVITLLPAHYRLLINISLKEPLKDENLKNFIITGKGLTPYNVKGGFVRIELKKDLQLNLRGTKKAQLVDCPVFIPALDKTAKSLNHAYTLISEKFETWRTSHVANVFQKIYWREFDYSKWKLLDVRRKQAETGTLSEAEQLLNPDVGNFELYRLGVERAVYHLEKGSKSFADYAYAMVEDLGEDIKPYLKGLYLEILHYPGFDNTGMENAEIIDNFDLQEITPDFTINLGNAEIVLKNLDFPWLESIEQLPDIDDSGIILAWDLEKGLSQGLTLIRYGNDIIWREPAYEHCANRFVKVAKILKQKYKNKLEDLIPTVRSKMALYGDDWSSIDKVKKARAIVSHWDHTPAK